MNNTPVSTMPMSPSLNEQIQNLSKTQPQVKSPVSTPNVNLEAKKDSVEIESKKEKPKKKGLMEKFANFVGSIKKFGVRLKEYTKGGIMGVGSFVGGTLAGIASIFTLHKTVQGVKIAKQTGASKLKTVLNGIADGISRNVKPSNLKKTLKTPKGIFTVIGGLAIGTLGFVSKMYKAKLAINEQSADIDHRYYNNPHDLSKQVQQTPQSK